MYCLSDEQVDYILNDIRRNGVEMEDLQSNLLDHVCCILEQNLKENDDFESFYQKTIRQFYTNELREIEVETIHLLTFKNYYGMKKVMIASGIYTAIAFVIGSFFKIMHWPGTVIFLASAMMVFGFIFLPTVFFVKTKEASSSRDKMLLGIATLIGVLYCASVLFLVQHWPGARVMWFSTLIISFFVLVPIYFFNGIRKPETKVNTIVTSIILTGVLGMQFTLTALGHPPEQKKHLKERVQAEKAFVNN